MNRALPAWLALALMLAGCEPSAPTSAAKADPTTESWYSDSANRLQNMIVTAAQLFQNGRKDEAAAIVTSGQSLQTRLLTAPHPTLPAMQAVADLDELYGRMLMSNGYFGEARMLFQKNVTRWKTWKPQTDDTGARLKRANAEIAECDRHMGA